MQPFKQANFADLPAYPRVPHPYFDTPSEWVEITGPFGPQRVHFKTAGTGPPLLLLHGLMTSSYSFRYLIEPLATDYRLIIPDLPGAGDTDPGTGRYTPQALADWLATLMQALDLRGAPVLGNSMGGYLCLWLAIRHPDTMGRLINLHSPGVPIARLYALRAAMSLPGSTALLGGLIGRDPVRWAFKNVHYYDESLKSLEEAKEYARPLQTREGVAAFASYLRDTMSPMQMSAFAAQAHRATLPMQFLFADTDPMVPPSVGPRLHTLFPHAEFHWLQRASHFAHVDAVGTVLPHVRGFLAAQSSDT